MSKLSQNVIQMMEALLDKNKTFEVHLERGKPVIVEVKRKMVNEK